MTYDLHLFRPPPRGDLLAAARASYEPDGYALPSTPEPGARERADAVAAALREADPSLEMEPAGEYVELNAPDDDGSGLQIVVFGDAADVHLPAWHTGSDALDAWDQAWCALVVLEREAGLRTYDPQQDRVLDLAQDLDSVRAEYEDMVASVRQSLPQPAPPRAPDRPWWKFWG
jgi:hypothetical protein